MTTTPRLVTTQKTTSLRGRHAHRLTTDVRAKYRPRLLAFADLCEQQLAAWAEAAQ